MQAQMQLVVPTVTAAPSPGMSRRAILAAATALALVAAGIGVARLPAATVDPDLARVIRCMALIKGAFGLAALVGAWWRLARPAAGWRGLAYVSGPPLMLGGAVALWSLHAAGAAALGLHAGLLALLAAALTDPAFFPAKPADR